MFYREDVYDFFMEKKSIIEAVDNFIDQFFDIYELLDSEHQNLMSECFQQMFRKYHYSTLIQDTPLTPANIINTLIEREYGKNLMVIPTFRLDFYKYNKIENISVGVKIFNKDEHYFVTDMEELLRLSKKGILIDELGIVLPEQLDSIKKIVTIPDPHYVNILCMSALEAGYLEKKSVGKKLVAKTSKKAEEFFVLNNRERLDNIISSVIHLCSRTITEAIPFLGDEFSEEAVWNLLKKPKDFDLILKPVLKNLGLTIKKFEEYDFSSVNNDDNMRDIFFFSLMLDMYFYTPFGYYLQLIQPIYTYEYDIEYETDNILMNYENIQSARAQLFMPPISYDLTPLGEAVLELSRKPRRKQKLPAEINDDEMYNAVEINRSQSDFWSEEDYVEDVFQNRNEIAFKVIDLEERRQKKKREMLKQEQMKKKPKGKPDK